MEHSSSEPTYMMCMRTTEHTKVPSVVKQCAKCLCDVWVTPASVTLAVQHNAQYLCTPCFMARMDKLQPGREIRLKMPTPAQMAEIKEALDEEKNS